MLGVEKCKPVTCASLMTRVRKVVLHGVWCQYDTFTDLWFDADCGQPSPGRQHDPKPPKTVLAHAILADVQYNNIGPC